MFKRMKIIIGFAFLGFILGVSAYITYKNIVPIVIQYFPFLLTVEWFSSGLVGAAFTLIILLLWATVSRSREI